MSWGLIPSPSFPAPVELEPPRVRSRNVLCSETLSLVVELHESHGTGAFHSEGEIQTYGILNTVLFFLQRCYWPHLGAAILAT